MKQWIKYSKLAASFAFLLVMAGCGKAAQEPGKKEEPLVVTVIPTIYPVYEEYNADMEPLVHSIPSVADDWQEEEGDEGAQEEKQLKILGAFQTYYGGSSQSRSVNIENAAKKIDGTVLRPGESFSCREAIAPFTESNGYRPAGTYHLGKIIESIGGGVCQISTTLYNAVLEAELQVLERVPHSMTVGYVDLSMDAAIAGEQKDLKFANSLEHPVTVHATTEDGWIIFEIEGIETRSENRSIQFEPVVLSKTEPPKDVITVDKTQEPAYREVTQEAHTGYRTALYKIIYKYGKEVKRELVNESSYSPSPQYVTVGGKEI